jgi:hypothetical protein
VAAIGAALLECRLASGGGEQIDLSRLLKTPPQEQSWNDIHRVSGHPIFRQTLLIDLSEWHTE